MSATVRWRTVGFTSRAAAQAYADGMDFVNDSAIHDIEVEKYADGRRWRWAVTYVDDDERDSDGDLTYTPAVGR